jgi:hypothetical protein
MSKGSGHGAWIASVAVCGSAICAASLANGRGVSPIPVGIGQQPSVNTKAIRNHLHAIAIGLAWPGGSGYGWGKPHDTMEHNQEVGVAIVWAGCVQEWPESRRHIVLQQNMLPSTCGLWTRRSRTAARLVRFPMLK